MDEQQIARRRSKGWMVVVLTVVLIFGAGTWMWLRGMQSDLRGGLRAEPDLADFGQVPDVTVVERSGKSLSLEDLRGQIWVANFIFTRCAGTCLTMSTKMSDLQKSLVKTKDVKLVSFTVDPEFDSREVLTDYSKRYQADPERWLFVSTSKEKIQDLAVNTFHLALQEGTDPNEPITHSTRFVLVDADGHIRGYYNSMEAEATQKLLTDLGKLMREEGE